MTRPVQSPAASTPSPLRVSRGHSPVHGGDVPATPWPIDHTRRLRFVRPLSPRIMARILDEAGYDEPVDVPSRLENVVAVGAVWLAVFSVGYFALQLARVVL